MNVKVEKPREKSQSRKVNGYVKAMLVTEALQKAADQARLDAQIRRAALSGGQMAEAERILGN